MMVVDRNM